MNRNKGLTRILNQGLLAGILLIAACGESSSAKSSGSNSSGTRGDHAKQASASESATSDNSSQTKSSMQIRLNHIAIYVTDLEISTAFYRDIIGLDTIPEPFHDGRHTWFSVSENAHLHLISGRTTPPEPEKNIHLCFSTGKMDKLLEKLKAKGIHYEDWAGQPFTVTKRVDGIRQTYLKDPDGYWIEINDDF